ncbi:MAG: LptF/LptG family permease [Myxococcota bacterium]
MSQILVRYVARLYLGLFFGVLLGALTIFLVGDLGDRWEMFLGKPAADVAELYFNKALLLVHQLSPVAMLLAAGATVSVLRKRGEWLAMQSLGVSRWVVMIPVGLCAAVITTGAVAWGELVVTRAGPRVDQLMVQKFGLWGDYRFFYFPQSWFRVGQHLFHVRGAADEAGVMHDVMVLEVGPAFQLKARYDAQAFTSLGGERWRLSGVTGRRFPGAGLAPEVTEAELDLTVAGTTPETFQLRVGRPEQMRLVDLLHQRKIRAQLGLGTERFLLAMHERFSFPFAGWVAAVLAALLALRQGRRGHLTLTLVEGLVVTVVLFSLVIIARRLALGEHLPVAAAAWLPALLPVGAVLALWWRVDVRWAGRARV